MVDMQVQALPCTAVAQLQSDISGKPTAAGVRCGTASAQGAPVSADRLQRPARLLLLRLLVVADGLAGACEGERVRSCARLAAVRIACGRLRRRRTITSACHARCGLPQGMP